MAKKTAENPMVKKYVKINAPGVLQVRHKGRLMIYTNGTLLDYDSAPTTLKALLDNAVANVARGKYNRRIPKVELVERIFNPKTGDVVVQHGERYIPSDGASNLNIDLYKNTYDAVKDVIEGAKSKDSADDADDADDAIEDSDVEDDDIDDVDDDDDDDED